MSDEPHRSPGKDVVLLTGPTEDGEGIRVVRAREERIEAGEVRPLKEGRPLGDGEIVKLAPRAGTPRLCDVEVVAKLGGEPRASGPPQVATSAYRESWDRIFGEPESARALN
jgi:hypothetical protein